MIAAGHVFQTHADTEVLLHGYEEWGTELLQKIRGMFAFAIWDNEKMSYSVRETILGSNHTIMQK